MNFNKNNEKYFCMFASCFPVRGANRSVIMDTERETFVYIPNSLYDLLPEFSKYKIQDLLNKYEENVDVLEEYLAYLLSYEIGFFTDTPHHFPKLDKDFFTPFDILDAIIEVSPYNIAHIENILKDLSHLGCQHLELRSFSHLSLAELDSIVRKAKMTRLRNIDIFMRYSEEILKEDFRDFLNANLIVRNIIVHSSSKDNVHDINGLQYITEQINDSSICGCNIRSFFTINLPFTLESLQFNNCLHKKVSIDKDGNIVNCLNIKEHIHGNISTHVLSDVIHQHQFQKLWGISKDKVNTCQVCEYRYMCSDCRAHLDDPYEKPKYCKYNPYTNEFEV